MVEGGPPEKYLKISRIRSLGTYWEGILDLGCKKWVTSSFMISHLGTIEEIGRDGKLCSLQIILKKITNTSPPFCTVNLPQISKIEMDIEGDSLIKRTHKALWEKLDMIIMDEWDIYEVIQKDLQTCNTIKDETKRVEIELGNMSKLVEQVKYYLNSRSKS